MNSEKGTWDKGQVISDEDGIMPLITKIPEIPVQTISKGIFKNNRINTMKARLIFLFVILFSLTAQAQNFWEPLDGPKGDSTTKNSIVCGNKIVLCISKSDTSRNRLYIVTGKDVVLINYYYIDGFWDVFASKKDYFWVTNMWLGPLETYYSTDYGKTFIDSLIFIYSPVSMSENSKKELYSISWQRKLCKSSDQLNWKIINNYTNDLNDKKIYINNQDELIFVTPFDTLGIQKYDPISYNQLFDKQILLKGKVIDFIISNDDSYYLLTDSLLYRSADEGTTFTVVLDAGPERKLHDLLEMNNMLFIATNKGVMTSADKGATWTDVNSGLNSFDCRSIGKTGDNTLYLGLAGDVVYRSVKYTSVEEETTLEQIVCTPNPATDFVEINCRGEVTSPLQRDIRIFNIFGQRVNLTPTLSIHGEGVRLDVSVLAPGMYFVRIGDRVSKFVKY